MELNTELLNRIKSEVLLESYNTDERLSLWSEVCRRYAEEVHKEYTAKPVETFRASFEKEWKESTKHLFLDSEDSELLHNLKLSLWQEFAGNYVDVLSSMHGWKSCKESHEKEISQLKKHIEELKLKNNESNR